METSPWIGVDGGGTHSTLVAVRNDGTVLGTASCGGLNGYVTGWETALERLCEAVSALLSRCGASNYAVLSVGSAALDGRAEPDQVKALAGDRIPLEKLELCGDVYMAERGACLGRSGIAVVSGTGAMVLGVDDAGEEHIAGGWGYRLGDPGSAYGVATESLRAVFAAEEGIGEQTALREAALRFFGAANVRGLIGRIYSAECEPAGIASFAQEAISLAESGDSVAARILEEQYRVLARQTARVAEACPGTICLWGGMFAHNDFVRALFRRMVKEETPSAAFGEAALPPELGAVIHAMKTRGALSEEKIQTMLRTWRDEK